MQNARPCDTCAAPVARTRPTGPISRYCSEACKPRCSVVGCDGPARKRGWCASHYAQQRQTGMDPQPFQWRWADETPCKVCGEPRREELREFCSRNCRMRWVKYAGNVPVETACVGCGCRIDLNERVGKQQHRRNPLTKFCRRCKGEYNKYALTTAQLAERDGTDCGICSQPVDMTLRRFDDGGLMCASVDHIQPRSLGGTHNPDNLQLAHLLCNMVKSDRVVDRDRMTPESEVV